MRQRLLSENRITKYLKYAIGEIILVVIGILIAIQINNLNQQSINRDFEVTMLKEIQSALKSDLQNHELLQMRLDRKNRSIQNMLSMIGSGRNYPDSILLNVYNQMTIGDLFTYNKGGFEAIKSVGLDKITNDSLRNELIKLYEVELPSIDSFYKVVIHDDSRNKEYRLALHNKLWKRVMIQLPDSSLKIVSQPIDAKNFLNQPELMDRIKIEQDNLNFTLFRLPYIKQILESRLALVNEELNAKPVSE